MNEQEQEEVNEQEEQEEVNEREEEAQRPKHLRKKYPPAVSAGDLVAVAWNNVFSIGKIMSNLEKNERKVVRMEEYVRKDGCYFKERRSRKRVVDVHSECIFEIADWIYFDSTKGVIKVRNFKTVIEHYDQYRNEFFL